MPAGLRTYRLLELGIPPSEIDRLPALLLDELLAIQSIHREVAGEASRAGRVDSQRQRPGSS